MCNPLLDSSKISRDWSFCCSSQFFKIIISSVEMPFHCSTRKLCFRGLLVCAAQKWTWWWCWRMLGFDCKRKVIWLVFTMSFSSYFAFWSHSQVNGFFFLFQRFAGSGTGGTTVSFEGRETSQPNAQDKGEWEVSWIWFVYKSFRQRPKSFRICVRLVPLLLSPNQWLKERGTYVYIGIFRVMAERTRYIPA